MKNSTLTDVHRKQSISESPTLRGKIERLKAINFMESEKLYEEEKYSYIITRHSYKQYRDGKNKVNIIIDLIKLLYNYTWRMEGCEDAYVEIKDEVTLRSKES